MRSTLLAFACVVITTLHAQPPAVTGHWTTIDDNTGKPRSVVEITVQDGVLSGRIVDLYDKSKLQKRCDLCPGDRKDQRMVGLEIIRAMRPDGDEWDDGTILDPETGKVYDCKLWIEDGPGSGTGMTLKVRGYVAFFYRTQVWVR